MGGREGGEGREGGREALLAGRRGCVVLRCAVLCYNMLCYVVCRVVLWCVVMCCAVLCRAVPCRARIRLPPLSTVPGQPYEPPPTHPTSKTDPISLGEVAWAKN